MASPVHDFLASVHADHLPDRSGRPYDAIPEMASLDPDGFGICLATVDGYLYEVGDTRRDFTIQSISKVFTYGLALADRGIEAVGELIDVEPSGEAFHEISVHPTTGRPRNAMINAGAIAAVALIDGDTPEERFERIRSLFSQVRQPRPRDGRRTSSRPTTRSLIGIGRSATCCATPG